MAGDAYGRDKGDDKAGVESWVWFSPTQNIYKRLSQNILSNNIYKNQLNIFSKCGVDLEE